ncbi:hypothetical protein [Streptomyces sp. NPDC021622]|uniref:hypothetical protein n=1 Tax=Streptomyces sp. NPDC021622 TaxID=3155013 RepID=UPI0033CC4EF4
MVGAAPQDVERQFRGCLDEAHRDFDAALVGGVGHAWEVSGEGLRALEAATGECWTRSYCLLYGQDRRRSAVQRGHLAR